MDSKVNEVLIESAIKKGISDIKEDPKRGMRNLIDLGSYFIKDKFQRNILDISKNALKNPNSPYYSMFENVVLNVDEEILQTFSFNFAYNSLTRGAKVLRKNKKLYKCFIPWIINFDLKDLNTNSLNVDEIIKIIGDGKSLGIYSYAFFIDKDIDFLFPILEKEKDCAFFIISNLNNLNENFIEKLNSFRNTYLSLPIELEYIKIKPIKDTLDLLKKSKSFYGVHSYYNHKNTHMIVKRKSRRNIKKLDLYSVFLIESNSKDFISNTKIKNFIRKSNRKRSFKTFVINYKNDIKKIQHSVSKDKFFVEIDSFGNLKIDDKNSIKQTISVRNTSLIESFMLFN